jgi:hypothetical protein
MLVFISDLHFVDGSAGEHNIPWRAFDYFFDDLIDLANRPGNQGKIKEIKLVLLGDIFDLLRTEAWVEPIPEDQRPWGGMDQEIEKNALAILNKIADHKNDEKGVDNAKVLELIRTRLPALKKECTLDYAPILEYIPACERGCGNVSAWLPPRIGFSPDSSLSRITGFWLVMATNLTNIIMKAARLLTLKMIIRKCPSAIPLPLN